MGWFDDIFKSDKGWNPATSGRLPTSAELGSYTVGSNSSGTPLAGTAEGEQQAQYGNMDPADVQAMWLQYELQENSNKSARDWYENMSNTAVQRNVADLEAAGLNKWLAVQNGSSGAAVANATGSGSSISQTHQTSVMQTLGKLIGTVAAAFIKSL